MAHQINKTFTCFEEKCMKNYGSLGSLQQHQRLKHPDLYFKEKHHKIEPH